MVTVRFEKFTKAQIDEFEFINNQLELYHQEMQLLSKHSQNDSVNPFKINLLNDILDRTNKLLGSTYKAIASFDRFDVESLPSNSDTVLVVSLYLGALEKFRTDHIRQKIGNWYWAIDDQVTDIKTRIPAKLGKK